MTGENVMQKYYKTWTMNDFPKPYVFPKLMYNGIYSVTAASQGILE